MYLTIQRIVIDKEYYKAKFGPGNKVSGNVEGFNFSNSLPNSDVPISSLVAIKQIDKDLFPVFLLLLFYN